MFTRFRRWLDKLPLTDPVEQQQGGVFQAVLIGWIAITTMGIPALFQMQNQNAAAPPPPDAARLLIPLTIAGMILWITPMGALALLRRGHFQRSVLVAATGIMLAHSAATYILGMGDPTVPIMYYIPIALVGLLLGRRTLLIFSGLSLVIVTLVIILQSQTPPMAGFLAINPATGSTFGPGQSPYFILGFFYAVTGLLTLLLDQFGSALRNALGESRKREDELQSIRSSLETQIGKRTEELRLALRDTQTRSEEQSRLLAEIEQQREMIRDLSLPIIPINATTLIIPLVGSLDSTRLQQLQEQSLHALERTSARKLVLDITGVPIVDSQVAQGFLMTVRSARLLGADVMLVGIRPEVAQTMVGIGVDLRDVHTYSDLQSALTSATA